MKSLIKQIPFIKKIHRQRQEQKYQEKFASDAYGCFWGVFETFEQAQQAAPQTKTIGYDNTELAQEYQKMLETDNWEGGSRTIASYDYPVLFWLKSAFEQGHTTLFDFGGCVGIHFYTYSKYLTYPRNIKWTICDVPEIIKVGKLIAEKREIDNLLFTSISTEVNGKDILLASGSLQYVDSISEMLSNVEKPKHIIINRLPLYEGKKFVTLQNGGKVFYPQYVFNKADFIREMEDINYQLIDIWEDRVDSCKIPFHPERSVSFYSGLYFKLKA